MRDGSLGESPDAGESCASRVGSNGPVPAGDLALDLEALMLLTAELAADDPRLFQREATEKVLPTGLKSKWTTLS